MFYALVGTGLALVAAIVLKVVHAPNEALSEYHFQLWYVNCAYKAKVAYIHANFVSSRFFAPSSRPLLFLTNLEQLVQNLMHPTSSYTGWRWVVYTHAVELISIANDHIAIADGIEKAVTETINSTTGLVMKLLFWAFAVWFYFRVVSITKRGVDRFGGILFGLITSIVALAKRMLQFCQV